MHKVVVKSLRNMQQVVTTSSHEFVADEPEVPKWPSEPPRDPEAIEQLSEVFIKSGYEMQPVLDTLFNSDFFKNAKNRRVKNPAELIAGTVKLTGSQAFPDPSMAALVDASDTMGQMLLNPPTVEGWHTGKEWIDGGTLNERINFAVREIGDTTKAGVSQIISNIMAEKNDIAPHQLVERCLEELGYISVTPETYHALLRHADHAGPLRFGSEIQADRSKGIIARMLQLIVSSTEYQFA